MKKVLSLVLALVLVLGMIPTFAAGETGAELLFEHEFIVGDGTGNLMVEKVLTRDEMAVLFAQMYGKEVEAAAFVKPADFTDVATFGWAANFISFAQESEWVVGYPDGTYQPKNVVTGKELLSAMMQVLGYEFEWETIVADAAAVGLTVSTEGPILRGAAFDTMWVAVSEIQINGEEMTIGEKTGKIEPPAPVVVDLALVSAKATNLGEVEVMFNNMIDEDLLDVDNFTIESETIEDVVLQEDGKTVIVEFLYANALDNQVAYTLEIAEITDVNGFVLEDIEVDFTANDFAAPVVEEVIIKGNKKIEVVFSEPVNPATAEMLSNYKINDMLFGAAISSTGRTVSLELTSRLPEGVHKIAVSTNVTDFAGFKVVSNNTEFSVASDTSKPALASVVSATQEKVVIMFTEAVESDFDVEALVGDFVKTTPKADDMTFTLEFDELPLAGTEITLSDVTDFYGNETAEITFNVVPTIDLVRPEVKSVVVDSQSEIIVTFTKDVAMDADAFVIEDEDGDEVAIDVAFDTDEDGNIEDVVILTAQAEAGFADGDYTLEVTGLEDTTPLKNKMIPYSGAFVVEDLTKPLVDAANYTPATKDATGALYVEFNEKVSASTALDKANYSFLSGSTPVALGSSHSVSLLGDGMTVKITIPKLASTSTLTTYPISSVTVLNVTDLAGNKIVSVVESVETLIATPIVLENPLAVATDKVEVEVTGRINPATVTASDFVLKYNNGTEDKTIYVVNAVYDEDDSIITLTLNNKLSTDAKYSTYDVELFVVAKNLADIYGNKVQVAALPTGGLLVETDTVGTDAVEDGIRPAAAKVASATFQKDVTATQAVIVVNLDEELDETIPEGTDVPTNIVIEINGKLVNNVATDVTYEYAVNEDDVAQLIFTIVYPDSQATLVGKAYSIKHYSLADQLEDAAENDIKDFTFTGTLKTYVAPVVEE